MVESLILVANSEDTLLDSLAGGKARNLARMSRLAYPVPAWFCVSQDAFAAYIAHTGLESLLASVEPTEEFEEKVRAAFAAADLPASLKALLADTLKKEKLDACDVAVRSSGLDEDAVDHSFAGQFSSFLYQQGTEQVSMALRMCWASAYSYRVLCYRQANGFTLQRIKMGVVIQKMIYAKCAGVAFSRHPIKVLNPELILISSVYGAGEGLVSGLLESDDYEFNRDDKKQTKNIVAKKERMVRSPEGGLKTEAVAENLQLLSSLSETQITKIAEMATGLEEKIGCPQDLEWTIDDEAIYLVQTRPITHLPPRAYYDIKKNGRFPILWDNSNIIESYSGVTSPLTFSFASRAYEAVYIQFTEIMGVPAEVRAQKASAFRNMLGLIRGRIYYNLGNWYELVLCLPGGNSNKEFMETMLGVKQGINPALQEVFHSISMPTEYTALAKFKLLIKTIKRFLTLDTIIADFFKNFNQTYDEARAQNFRTTPLPELVRWYYDLERKWTYRWEAPLINDYLCMVFFGLLKKLTANWIDSKGVDSLQNDLLCGEGGLDSTEPTKFLMRMADTIDNNSDKAFRTWFVATETDLVLAGLRSDKKDQPAAKQLEEFLDRFGFRCVNELKLEELDLHDDPSFIVSSLQSYVKSGSYKIHDMEERERAIRAAAESKVKEKLSGPKLALYMWILRQARRAVKNRENLRFTRTKSFGVSRHLFRAIGAHLTELKMMKSEMDIFYLTVEEIIAFVEGRNLTMDIGALVELRRKEFDEFRNTPSPPDRFISYGALGVSQAHPTLLFEADLLRDLNVNDDPNVLKGTPCCPGVVEGFVRVVETLAEAKGMDGEILVTARTDPGWVPLYPSCSGLLIERGSLLSHSAVVARELGLPTIVGISGGLMKRLKTGDKVRIDAGKGEVVIISRAGDA